LLWLKKGEIDFLLGNYPKALASFRKAEEQRNGVSSYWLAKTYASISDTSSAMLELKRHLESSPKKIESEILTDTAFNKLWDTPQWRKIWLTNWYSNNERFIADIYYHFARNDWEYALDLLNERMTGRKSNHQLYALRGEAYYNIGSHKAALSDFTHAHKRNRRNHEYIAWRAKIFIAQTKFKLAEKEAQNAIELSGGEPRYFLLLAQSFAGQSNYLKATDNLKVYLSYYPNCYDAINLYANYSAKAGNNIEALLYLGRLIKTNPTDYQHYFLRGAIYMQSGNWAMAEIDFNQGIKLNPNSSDALLNRGICKQRQGKISEACADWQQAIKLGSFQAQEFIYRNCR
jgi:tetratricopeptide (TPR) repeat protein